MWSARAGTALPSRISAALSSARHTDALVLLAELRLRHIKPKLGALQRWVRECDAASRSDGSFGDTMVLRVLDAILRATSGVQVELSEVGKGRGEGVVRKMDDWHLRPASGVKIYDEIVAGSFPRPEDHAALASGFKLLHTTPGPERLPPNEHPALLFASHDRAVALTDELATTRHDVPHIPGAFLLADLLSLDECRRIIGAAEAVGFAPDKPLTAEVGGSVLAHNLYWLADEPFMQSLYKRFLHLVPQQVDGGRVTGLNRRFRVYRYVPGAIYRPHIDGAWPASGTDEKGEYVYDSSPKDKPQWSRLTFLIYLNDDFDNGCTTFFLPSPVEGSLHAYGVKPKAGCALVFGHGDTNSLLHEGSPVVGGAKYVIRTEVLYESSHPTSKPEGEPNEDGDEL